MLLIESAFDIYSIEELYNMTDIDFDIINEDIETKENDDFLNKRNYRNSQNTNVCSYNCGGYALNTFNWYKPYEGDFEWREELIDNWLGEYYDCNGELIDDYELIRNELENRLLIRDSLYMLRQFKGKLRRVESEDELWEGERLIAYRVGLCCWYDEVGKCFRDIDIDFHYRFYDQELKVWFEKMGCGDIHVCSDETITDYAWDYSHWSYTSKIALFALQLS